jgi:hypothetical protein
MHIRLDHPTRVTEPHIIKRRSSILFVTRHESRHLAVFQEIHADSYPYKRQFPELLVSLFWEPIHQIPGK